MRYCLAWIWLRIAFALCFHGHSLPRVSQFSTATSFILRIRRHPEVGFERTQAKTHVNCAAYTQTQGLTFGNSGRNSLNNPHRTNFDMSIYKIFRPTPDNLCFSRCSDQHSRIRYSSMERSSTRAIPRIMKKKSQDALWPLT